MRRFGRIAKSFVRSRDLSSRCGNNARCCYSRPCEPRVSAHTASIKGTRQVETGRNSERGDTRAETPLRNGKKNEVEVARRVVASERERERARRDEKERDRERRRGGPLAIGPSRSSSSVIGCMIYVAGGFARPFSTRRRRGAVALWERTMTEGPLIHRGAVWATVYSRRSLRSSRLTRCFTARTAALRGRR